MEGGKNPPSFIYGLTRLKSARTATAEAATRTVHPLSYDYMKNYLPVDGGNYHA